MDFFKNSGTNPQSNQKPSGGGASTNTNRVPRPKNQLSQGLNVEYQARHWYSLELDVQPTSCFLIPDAQLSTPTVPVYDLGYIAQSPYGQLRRIPNIATKMRNPQQMQLSTQLSLQNVQQPNSVNSLPPNTVADMPPNVWWMTSGSMSGAAASTSSSVSSINADAAASSGKISIIDMTTPGAEPLPITTMPGWGFTETEWVDMDADGFVDCVTITAQSSAAQLVWLRQPSDNKPWELNVIVENIGGTSFKVLKIAEKEKGSAVITQRLVIIVAGFRRSELIAIWVDDEANDWTRSQKIRTKVIDKAGAYFSIDVTDLNGDGRPDILTSIAGVRGRSGGVVCYEIPTDFTNEKSKWLKHILSTDFSGATSFNRVTPGISIPFLPKAGISKPSVLVSGFDDGQVYVLRPTSWSPYIWKYTTDVIFKRPTSIGTPAIGDADGDGVMEIFIPEAMYIHVLSYEHQYTKMESQLGKNGVSSCELVHGDRFVLMLLMTVWGLLLLF